VRFEGRNSIEQPSLGSRGPLRTGTNAVKVGYRPTARGFFKIEVNGGPESLHNFMKDIPAVPLQYQAFRWHYVKGYLYKKEGLVASRYYLWRANRLHGRAAIDAYNAGRRAWKVLQLREDEAS
jgi:hypothetical protein